MENNIVVLKIILEDNNLLASDFGNDYICMIILNLMWFVDVNV